MAHEHIRRVFTGQNVVLPGQDQPTPATIVVDGLTGKITDITDVHAARHEFPDVPESHWVDAGRKVILPGLVE